MKWAMSDLRITVAFAVLPLTILWRAPALAEERFCQADSVTGEARLVQAGKESPLETGRELGADDILITGPAARVGIKCSDGIILTIGPETELELGTLVGEIGDRNDVLLNLDRGITRFLAPLRTWRIFAVAGPSGVASVRSTEWVMLAEDGATSVLALNGQVAVKANGVGGAVLVAGAGIDIDPTGKVVKVGKWGPTRVAKVKSALALD